jgi:hypothetical protein
MNYNSRTIFSASSCIIREIMGAYPSGDAAIAKVFSRGLCELVPDKAAIFEALAKQISEDRELAGFIIPPTLRWVEFE